MIAPLSILSDRKTRFVSHDKEVKEELRTFPFNLVTALATPVFDRHEGKCNT